MSIKGEVDIISVLEELVVQWGVKVIARCRRVLQERKQILRVLPMQGTSRETRMGFCEGQRQRSTERMDKPLN